MAAVRRSLAAVAASALALGGVLVVSSPAHAADFVVDTLSDDPADGFTLREAIEDANAAPGADTITFDPALFTPSGTILLDSMLPGITETLTIAGPGSGTLTLARSATLPSGDILSFFPDGADQDVTIQGLSIEGDGVKLGSAVVAYNLIGGVPRNVTLTDVTILDMVSDSGPALFIDGVAGTVRIEDSTIEGNETDADGCVYIVSTTDVVIENTSVTANDAVEGGVLFLDGVDTFAFVDSTATGNTASSNGGFASLNDVGSATFRGAALAANTAGIGGGAVYVDAVATLRIEEESSFTENSAQIGGAVYVDAGDVDVTVAGSEFIENEATDGQGGAMFVAQSQGDVTIAGSRFVGNTSTEAGGALHFDETEAPVRVATSTFADNESYEGGAISIGFVVDSFVVDSSTFTGNDADDRGAGLRVAWVQGELEVVQSTFDETGAAGDYAIFVLVIDDGELLVRHSTVVGPGGIQVLDGVEPGSSATVSHSIVQSTTANGSADVDAGGPIAVEWSALSDAPGPAEITAGAGVRLNTNALLGPLQDNGGPTFTRLPAANSPAVDQGDPSVAGAPATDQRGAGFARILGGRIDIGAVERPFQLPPTGSEPSGAAALFALLGILAGTGVLVAAARRRAGSHAL